MVTAVAHWLMELEVCHGSQCINFNAHTLFIYCNAWNTLQHVVLSVTFYR